MKHIRLIRVLIFFAGLLLSMQGFSQSDSVFTLVQCIDSVRKYSYLLLADKYSTEAARKNLQISHALTLPYISGELAMEGRLLKPYNFSQQWAVVHGDWSLGNFIKKTDQVARQEVITAQLIQEQTLLDGISRVASLFMGILQKKKELELLNNRLLLLQTHRLVARSLWKAGIRTRIDILQTESEISVMREEITRTTLDARNLRQELARLTGQPDGDSLRLAGINMAALVKQIHIAGVNGKLLEANPLYQILLSKIKAQNLRTKLVNAEKWPHLFVGSGFFGDGDPTGDGNYWLIHTGIAFPIYQWGVVKYRREESQAVSQSFTSELLDLQRELKIHLEKTVARIQELDKLLSLQKARLQTAEEMHGLADANYKAGLITNLEYLSIQQRVTTTKITIEQTRLEYIMNLIEYYLTTNQVEKIKNLGNYTLYVN